MKSRLILNFLIFFNSCLFVWGCGYFKISTVSPIITLVYFLLIILCYVIAVFNKSVLLFFSIFLSVISLYFPTGIEYGLPTPELLSPLLNTDLYEIKGYFEATWSGYILSFLFILCQFLLVIVASRILTKRKILLLFLVPFLVCFFGPVPLKKDGIDYSHSAFVKAVYLSTQSILKSKQESASLLNPSSMKNYSVKEGKDNGKVIVIVIGESVRKDYLGVYGYEHQTTPFLSSSEGIFFANHIAAAPSTSPSLNHTLFKVLNKNILWNENVISWAKLANYDTYWISNQGKGSVGDDVFYSLSKTAKKSIFLKDGNWDSQNIDDFDLLNKLEEVITENSNSKVVFLHMMGSHEPVCSRILGFETTFGSLANLTNCYVGSIEKLDAFMKKLSSILQKEKKEFQIVYFSDHGLSVSKDKVYHDIELKNAFQVPFFILGSDIKEKQYIAKTTTALNFLDIYASLLGLSGPLIDSNYKYSNLKNLPETLDPLVYWNGWKHFSSYNRTQQPIFDLESSQKSIKTVSSDKKLVNLDCKYWVEYVKKTDTNKIYVEGWVSEKRNGAYIPLKNLFLLFDCGKEKYLLPTDTLDRQDVANYFKNTEDNNYGFAVTIESKFQSSTCKIYFATSTSSTIKKCLIGTSLETSQ